MKKLIFTLVCLGFIVLNLYYLDAQTPLTKHPDTSGWRSLFTSDLKNAIYPEGIWHFDNGVLFPDKDEVIWSDKMYQNFMIDLEFKNADGTNSGVIVYGSDRSDWIPNSVEIQIADDFSEKWKNADKTWQCGAVFGHLAASKSVVKKPGEWNRMTISCMGKNIRIILNNELVTVMDMNLWKSAKVNPDGSSIPAWLSRPFSELATKGYIGLQGKHADAIVYFRNIKIKEL